MNFLDHHRLHNLQLLVRNEGKIKSYESCCDIRAWSHNTRTRDLYLREWIKCDMPLCVVPCSTLIGFFRTMTCKRSGRATPRCHPDCKSKVILESITTSCDAMKECLKADESLEKYFMEEDLETSHWPCERCLEALKSIKTFWRIMLERVFAINVTRNECFEESASCCTTDSVRNMARIWKKDMIQQAMFVKTITPQIICQNRARNCCKKQAIKKVSSCRISVPCTPCSDGDAKPLLRKSSRITCNSNRHSSHKKVTIDCSPSTSRCKTCQTPPRRLCRCISAKVRTVDVGVNCSECGEEKACNSSIECLKKNYDDLQREEIEQLKKENCSLKCELQNIYKSCKWKAYYCTDSIKSEKGCTDIVPQVPQPFEYCVEDNTTCTTCTSAKDADSELVITMKNCKHESFRHVSLLQVLHKTNDPCKQDCNIEGPCYKSEDPISLLTRVQATLGAMVKRELALAKCRKRCGSNSEIEASFQRVNQSNACKSSASHTTLSSRCTVG